MGFPANASYVTVTGTFTRADGTAASGKLRFTPDLTGIAIDAAANVLFPNSGVEVVLDAQGAFSIDLLVSNDADVQPVGFTYTVEEIVDRKTRTYTIYLDSAGPATVQLASVSPAVVDPGTVVTTQRIADFYWFEINMVMGTI